jgi:hypothetical protein
MSEALAKELEGKGGSPSRLVALALEKGADPDTLSKLLDLQERWEAGEARKQYVTAMTAFKQEAPSVLKKCDRVDFTTAKGRTFYNYANLGSIVQEITAIMGKHDLSASWGTAQDGRNVTVTCHITHVAGHRESVTLTGPIDESGNKNSIQAVGSTVTYLQRYTLLAALGLATGEDDDGRQGAGPGNPPGGHQPPIQEPGKKSESVADIETLRSEIDSMLLTMYSQQGAADKLEELTTWTDKKKSPPETVKGFRDVARMKHEKNIQITHGKVKKLYDEWLVAHPEYNQDETAENA